MLDLGVFVAMVLVGAMIFRMLLRAFLHRRAAAWTVAALASFCLVSIVTYEISRSTRFQMFGHMVLPRPTREKVVALTFDDGPTSKYTPEIVETLRAHRVRATFFLMGAEIANAPEAARLIAAEGHEIGNHSWSHDRMVFKRESWIAEEIERTDGAIRSSGYTGPILFRSPYGKRFVSLPWYLARHDRLNIFWDLAPDSAGVSTTAQLVEKVVTEAKPGSIVLLHLMYPQREPSRRALPSIIDSEHARSAS